jgi:hypothetical protein
MAKCIKLSTVWILKNKNKIKFKIKIEEIIQYLDATKNRKNK